MVTDDDDLLEQLGKEDDNLKKVKETIEEYNRNKYAGIFDDFPNEYFDECELGRHANGLDHCPCLC